MPAVSSSAVMAPFSRTMSRVPSSSAATTRSRSAPARWRRPGGRNRSPPGPRAVLYNRARGRNGRRGMTQGAFRSISRLTGHLVLGIPNSLTAHPHEGGLDDATSDSGDLHGPGGGDDRDGGP